MRFHLAPVSACSAIALFLGACASAPEIAPDPRSAKVFVTRKPDDVKGKTRVGDVSASAEKLFGTPENLRKQATIKIQQEAASKGATAVLIQKDDFQSTPINNINLIGVAYK
jgi:hypothetical protein